VLELLSGEDVFDPGAGLRTSGRLAVQKEGKAEVTNVELLRGSEGRMGCGLRDWVVLSICNCWESNHCPVIHQDESEGMSAVNRKQYIFLGLTATGKYRNYPYFWVLLPSYTHKMLLFEIVSERMKHRILAWSILNYSDTERQPSFYPGTQLQTRGFCNKPRILNLAVSEEMWPWPSIFQSTPHIDAFTYGFAVGLSERFYLNFTWIYSPQILQLVCGGESPHSSSAV
jgi:hypothetical protein